jgi:uncharacterized repeat protein (TIGR02543 family)
MCRHKPGVLHLFLLILIGISLFACNRPIEGLIPELEDIEVDIESMLDEYIIEDFDMQGMFLILYFDDGTTEKITITKDMINQVDKELFSLPGTHEITINYSSISTTFFITMVHTALTQQLHLIYNQALESQLITSSYEEWLESIRGEDGTSIVSAFINEDGHLILTFCNDEVTDVGRIVGYDGIDGLPVLLKVEEGYIKWSYEGEITWKNLISLIELVGLTGAEGVGIEKVVLNTSYELIITLSDDRVVNLGDIRGEQGLPGSNGLDGTDGKEVSFQVSEGYIQWQYLGDNIWTNLIELAALVGPTGSNGLDGTDGKEVLFQVSEGYIQWQYLGDSIWTNLIELATLVGPAGSNGLDGTDGKEVSFQVSEGYIQWQYLGDSMWINLIEIDTLTGIQGVGISNTSINHNNELIITYTDGTVVNIGQIYITYTVNFVGLDEYLIDTQKVAYGSDAIEPTVPLIDGYTFVGWSSIFTNIISNVNVTALYEINTYTLTFDSNGGSTIDPLNDVEYGTIIGLPNPVKDGYIFKGWYFGNHVNDGQFTNSTQMTMNTILYARWESELFQVIFVDSNNNVLKVAEVVPGGSTTPPEAPTREGYQFVGWTKPYINISSNTIIQTIYEVNQYDINYYIYDNYDPTLSIPLYPGETIISVSLGYNHSSALTSKGRLFVWGSNGSGQLGESTILRTTSPIDITSRFNLKAGETIVSVSLGDSFSVASTSIGRVYTWGNNVYAELGIGTKDYDTHSNPIRITGNFYLEEDETIVEVVAGDSHSSIITSLGNLYTWGCNNYGQLGDGTSVERNTVAEITNQFNLEVGETIFKVSLGKFHSSAITSYGRIFTWGLNGSSQLGDGTSISKSKPVEITNYFNLEADETIVDISLGDSHSSAVTSFGRIFTWGSNGAGQLGDGTNTKRSIPIDVTSFFNLKTGETITDISLGNSFSSALTSSGRVFTWGWNSYGQLGDNTLNTSTIPVEITSQFNLDSNETIVDISLGSQHSSAITSLGRVFTWGNNLSGELGDGTTISKSIPVEMQIQYPELDLLEQYDYGDLVIEYTPTRDGYLICDWINVGTLNPFNFGNMPDLDITLINRWKTVDYSITYQLDGGINSTNNPSTYTIETNTIYIENPYKEGHSFMGWYYDEEFIVEATTTILQGSIGDITLYAKWQINNYDLLFYVYDGLISTAAIPLCQGETITSVSAGYNHSMALTSTGRVFVWGRNHYGQLGIETSDDLHHPKPIEITSQFSLEANENIVNATSEYDLSFVITSTGRLFMWGNNNFGQLGDGTNENKYKPTEITSKFNFEVGEKITSVSIGGSHTSVLTSLGRMFTWGRNTYGQLGDGTTTSKYIPIDITSQFNLELNEIISSISLGGSYSSALTSSGRVFMWGGNSVGQLGDGTTEDKYSPTEITSQFNLELNEIISSISLGGSYSSAITSSGRIFMWGHNCYGQLGDGTTNNLLVPTEITNQFNLESSEIISGVFLGIGHSSAITSLGRVFTWGYNYSGQLGDGTTISKSIPTDITSQFNLRVDESVSSISLGYNYSSSITSEGRIFTWGYNGRGELGDGTTTSKSMPIEMKIQNLDLVHSENHVYGSPISEYTLSREAYNLSNWYRIHLGVIYTNSFNTMPGENLLLYAYWIPIQYSITYHLDGGTNSFNYPFRYTIESETIQLGTPTKDGNTFVGWYLNEEFSGDVVSSIPQGSTGDLVLYAKWQINQYDVNYYTYENYDPTTYIPLYQDEVITDITLGDSHSSAITSFGRTFMWGGNSSGQLGDGTTSYSTIPIDITDHFCLNSSVNIISVSLGYHHSAALSSDGRVFTWGYNIHGQLGDGTTTTKYKPTEITNMFNLGENEIIVSISLAGSHSSALTSSGRMFTWGNNSFGGLGDGTTTSKSIPTEITSRFNLGVDESISSISLGHYYSSAITSTNRVFTWGWNNYGQLGDGTTTSKTTPNEITSQFNLAVDESVESVSLGGYHMSAITSAGRILIWGRNDYQQLGDGTGVNKSTPIEITSRFSLELNERIVSVSLGGYHSSAITSTSRMFTWGHNYYGQLGDGTTSLRNIPTEITTQFNLDVGETILHVSLYSYHSSLITSSRRIFMWGYNIAGQLGDGTTVNKLIPTEIKTQNVILELAETYDYNSSIIEYIPTKEGYVFSGWYIDMGMTTKYTFATMPAEDIKLYGYWIIE